MARPHPALLRLAAGHDPGPIGDADDGLLASAIDHGMQGLLWTWVRDHPSTCSWRTTLAGADLTTRQRHQRLWDTLVCARARLAEGGIDVATIKGVTAEARWYSRQGERPCHDVDLLIAPDAVDRAGAVLDALQPHHPLRREINGLAASGVMQSVDAVVDGVAVDVHFDLLKLGIPTRHRETAWARTEPYPLPDGTMVRVPDAELSLIQFVLHLNKDSFAWLLGFVDVARILQADELDWGFVDRFLRAEGLEVVAYRSLRTVTERLGLPVPDVAGVSGPRAWAWRVIWPERVTLLGSAGTDRSRRQDLIPFLTRGRLGDAVRWAWRAVLPPASTVAVRYHDIPGPYPWRLARGRVRTARKRRAALRARHAAPPATGCETSTPRDPAVTARLLRAAGRSQAVWLDVSGRSMGWSIPGGRRVQIETGERPRRGEVWAFCDDDGNVVVHRCRGNQADGFRFQGDAMVRDDGVITGDRLVGRIVDVAPSTARLRWSPLAGAVQRTPRMAVAAAHRHWRQVRGDG